MILDILLSGRGWMVLMVTDDGLDLHAYGRMVILDFRLRSKCLTVVNLVMPFTCAFYLDGHDGMTSIVLF
jgi:hypothetical protein